jgi:acetyl-CoA carboxylase biotin carboxyl carrier protein
MNFDLEQIQALAQLATDKGLAEITITDGDQSVTIKTPSSVAQPSLPMAGYPGGVMMAPAAVAASLPAPLATVPVVPSSESQTAAPPPARSTKTKAITSPMVGTFYRSAGPDKPAFVEKGQAVAVGDTLCILEAMKQMNQLESELAGTIIEVLVANGTPVDYGQELFLVEVA